MAGQQEPRRCIARLPLTSTSTHLAATSIERIYNAAVRLHTEQRSAPRLLEVQQLELACKVAHCQVSCSGTGAKHATLQRSGLLRLRCRTQLCSVQLEYLQNACATQLASQSHKVCSSWQPPERSRCTWWRRGLAARRLGGSVGQGWPGHLGALSQTFPHCLRTHLTSCTVWLSPRCTSSTT